MQATGSLRPVQLVAVGAQVSGRITKMNAAIGQRVAAGDLVAEIDNLTQQNDLRTAEAALEDVQAQKRQKEATLAYDEWALDREEKTLAKQATSRDSWELAKAAAKRPARRSTRSPPRSRRRRSRSTARASTLATPG